MCLKKVQIIGKFDPLAMLRETRRRNWLCYVRERNRAFPLCSRVLRNTSSSSSKAASNGSCRGNLSTQSVFLSLSLRLCCYRALHYIHTYIIDLHTIGIDERSSNCVEMSIYLASLLKRWNKNYVILDCLSNDGFLMSTLKNAEFHKSPRCLEFEISLALDYARYIPTFLGPTFLGC